MALSLMIDYEWSVEEGEYEEALLAIESAKLLYKKHQLWEEYVNVLVKMSGFADYLDDATKSNYAKQALDAAKLYLPQQHLLLAAAYRQKGEVCTIYEKYDSSLYYYKKALPIFEDYRDWEEVAWTKLLQSVNYYYLGETESGLRELEDGLWDTQNWSEDIYSSLFNLRGIFYKDKGDLSNVITNTEDALSLELSNHTSIDSAFLGSLYNNMGIAYDKKGDIKRAIDYYQKALTQFQQLNKEGSNQVRSNINIGIALLSQEKNKEAISIFQKEPIITYSTS